MVMPVTLNHSLLYSFYMIVFLSDVVIVVTAEINIMLIVDCVHIALCFFVGSWVLVLCRHAYSVLVAKNH
jgi:hypothetical protein